MAKRRYTLDELRSMVRARMTKGSAFMLNHKAYDKLQAETTAKLAVMSFAEILQAYPEYTYDVKG